MSRAKLIAELGSKGLQTLIESLTGLTGDAAVEAAKKLSKKDQAKQELLRNTVGEVEQIFSKYGGSKPNVPQRAFARSSTGNQKIDPAIVAALQDKGVKEKMLAGMEKGRPQKDWYNMEPTRLMFGDVTGSQTIGDQRFNRLQDYMGTTSSLSKVDPNIKNATRWLGYDINKTPPEENLVTVMENGKPKEKLDPQPPPGYGGAGQIVQYKGSMPLLRGDISELDPDEAMKTSRYTGALKGNLANVPVDRHAVRAPLMLHGDPAGLSTSVKLEKGVPTFNAQQRVAEEGMDIHDTPVTWWKDVPKNAAEYYALEDYYKMLSNELGLDPAEGQASAWTGMGPITGVESDVNMTAQQLFNQRVAKTAIERGMDPRDVLTRMMTGKQPLSIAAGAGLGTQFLPGGSMREER